MTREKVAAGSWFTTLVGATLLLGLGFGVGLFTGVVTDDPGLVWAHVAGDSVEAPLPSVASSAEFAANTATTAEPVLENATRALSGFAVQVGAFAEAAPADKLRKKLVAQGFSAYVVEEADAHRVRVGPVSERSEAESLAGALVDQDYPTWILREGE
ncbi:MAG: SPOR domain-containing protein [Myxococcales bacterium]|nr:SPOR domain-containing protein [Myxococcales bacterium]